MSNEYPKHIINVCGRCAKHIRVDKEKGEKQHDYKYNPEQAYMRTKDAILTRSWTLLDKCRPNFFISLVFNKSESKFPVDDATLNGSIAKARAFCKSLTQVSKDSWMMRVMDVGKLGYIHFHIIARLPNYTQERLDSIVKPLWKSISDNKDERAANVEEYIDAQWPYIVKEEKKERHIELKKALKNRDMFTVFNAKNMKKHKEYRYVLDEWAYDVYVGLIQLYVQNRDKNPNSYLKQLEHKNSRIGDIDLDAHIKIINEAKRIGKQVKYIHTYYL